MKKIKSLKLANIIYRFISSILIFNIINLIRNSHNYDIEFMQNLNVFYILMSIIAIFMILSVINLYLKNKFFDYLITIISFFICSILWLNDDNIFFLIIIFLLFLLLYHFKPQDLEINISFSKHIYFIMIIILGIFMFYHIASIVILRYKLFYSPNFDLGIPGQNFYYLKKIGIPFSTCERDVLVNHFLIHFSLIYYLILPIYFIFSHVITIQVVSAILISSSIMPIYLLCRKYKLTQMITIMICLIFCTYAPAICGIHYDFHENTFLFPLLLWLFYFYEKNNSIGIFLFSVLVLLVKEDAAIYIIIFSIFMLFDRKTRYGIPLLVISFLYFIIVTYFLKAHGTGIMIDRYDNLLYDSSNMFGIIKTLLINPGYFLKQLITSPENNINKIKYIIELLLPLGFIPLYSKDKRNYLLLIPMLLTLMTTYKYSYDINYHYSYGIMAFMFYLFIKNIKDLNIKKYLFICLIAGILAYRTYAFPYLYSNMNDYQQNKSELTNVEELLKEIPQSASVNASTFILPHLVNRNLIYEVYYHNDIPDIDYVVLDTRYDDYLTHYENYINNGYTKINEIKNIIIILKK